MHRARHDRRDSGAAAVEFALVVPVLLALVFGIIDYGIYFSDSLALRAGVREGARQGVVEKCDATPFTESCLVDLIKSRVDPIAGGQTYVKLATPRGWKHGETLVVCAVLAVDGATGLSPLPHGKSARSKTSMRIEQDDAALPSATRQDVLPAQYGAWSDFCP